MSAPVLRENVRAELDRLHEELARTIVDGVGVENDRLRFLQGQSRGVRDALNILHDEYRKMHS